MVERGTGPKSLMEGMNGCRELDHCLAACSGFGGSIGFESDGSMRCVAITCLMPPNGTPCFPFYRPSESMGYSGGKEENERKKSFRITGSFFSSMRVLLIM